MVVNLSDYNPPTEEEMAQRRALVAQHQKFAQQMLEDEKVYAVFRRVGISGDFTEEEFNIVQTRAKEILAEPIIEKALEEGRLIQGYSKEEYNTCLKEHDKMLVHNILVKKWGEDYAEMVKRNGTTVNALIEDLDWNTKDDLILYNYQMIWPNVNISDYQFIVVVLMRRVVTGMYSSVFSEDATKFAVDNTFVYEDDKLYTQRMLDQRISFEDFVMVLKEFMAWERFEEYLDAYLNTPYDEDNEASELDQMQDLYWPLQKKSYEIFRKYGFVGRFRVTEVAKELVDEGKGADDLEAVKRLAKRWSSETRIVGILGETKGLYS